MKLFLVCLFFFCKVFAFFRIWHDDMTIFGVSHDDNDNEDV